MEAKKQLREQMKEKLNQLSLPQYEDLSYRIAKHLYNDDSWKRAETIGITISREFEVDTFQIIRKAWEQGKNVTIPKCLPGTKELEFRLFTRFSQLEMVYSNLYEPKASETIEVRPENIDLLFVPGLAFANSGFRLGFGGGYYDRFLKEFKGETVGLAFGLQMIAEIPIEPHDIAVPKILTEKGACICGE